MQKYRYQWFTVVDHRSGSPKMRMIENQDLLASIRHVVMECVSQPQIFVSCPLPPKHPNFLSKTRTRGHCITSPLRSRSPLAVLSITLLKGSTLGRSAPAFFAGSQGVCTFLVAKTEKKCRVLTVSWPFAEGSKCEVLQTKDYRAPFLLCFNFLQGS